MVNEEKMKKILKLYNDYIIKVNNLTDITPWCSKKTYTQKVAEPSRTNEQRQLDALAGKKMQLGDKYYVYFRPDGTLGTVDSWNNDHDVNKLMARIWSTLKIFENVIPMDTIPKYHLKNKAIKSQLQDLLTKV